MREGIARIIVYITIMTGLCACGGAGSSNTSNSGTIGSYTVGQDGTVSSPWGDGSSTQRPAMAVKFTPTSYPVTISSVTIYARNNTGSEQKFNLYGFNELSTETELFNHVQNQSLSYAGTSNVVKSINIPATTISSGSFYIAVEWVTKPLTTAAGTNAFFLCTDSRLDYPNTNFIRLFGSTWASVESIGAPIGDVGIISNY